MENQAVKAPAVMIVEGDPSRLTGIAAILDQIGYRCFLAATQETAIRAVQSMQFDLILYSFDSDALQAAERASQLRYPNHMKQTPIVFMADDLQTSWIEPLNLAGGVYCLPKSLAPEELLAYLEKALYLPHLAAAKVSPAKPHFSSDWVRLEK